MEDVAFAGWSTGSPLGIAFAGWSASRVMQPGPYDLVLSPVRGTRLRLTSERGTRLTLTSPDDVSLTLSGE